MKNNRWRFTYAALGLVLGLGAPIGWLLFRMTSMNMAWIGVEMMIHKPLYIYMTIGTSGAFAIFGFLLGRHDDHLAAASKEVESALVQAKSMAVTDALTGLSNARDLHDQLSSEIEMATRYNLPLTCLMLDIDDFKKINDEKGHPFGDAVLKDVARTIRCCVRSVDIAGRLGGEEFLVIMRHTPPDAGYPVAERIRDAIQRFPFTFSGDSVRATVSIGLASLSVPSIRDKSGLLKAADDALYLAKRTGKNRIVIHQATPREKETENEEASTT